MTNDISKKIAETLIKAGTTFPTDRMNAYKHAIVNEAQVYGKYDIQNDLEKEITSRVNAAGCGPLGLGGEHSVLATFLKVGSLRASGVRIVSIRPDCCFEPRVATLEL